MGRAMLEVRGRLAWEPRGTTMACQVRPAHAGRGMGASTSHCSKAWRGEQRGIFCVCIYNIPRLQLNLHLCLGSSLQAAPCLSPF